MKPTIRMLLREFTSDFARLNEIPKNLANPKYHAYLEGADDFAELLERKLASEARINELQGALREISSWDECLCDHSDENCCSKLDLHCAHCIAEIALGAAESK